MEKDYEECDEEIIEQPILEEDGVELQVLEEADEYYTIDIDSTKSHIIFGGKSECVEIHDYKEDTVLSRIEDFDDSILYTKFLPNNRFIIVTVNGTIALMEYDQQIYLIDLGEDITAAKFNEKLVIGTVNGQIYLYDAELEHINTFGDHESEIIEVDYCEGRILSMCKNFLVAHDEYGRCLYTLKASDAKCFKYIASDVIAFGRENKVQIFKQTRKLFDHTLENSIETIEFISKSLVIGGDFNHILLMDTTGHYAIFKLDIKTGVNLIKKYDEYKAIFATADGFIGIIDIRDIRTLKFYFIDLGTIFDFAISTNNIAIVGENGFKVIDLINDSSLSLDDLEQLNAE